MALRKAPETTDAIFGLVISTGFNTARGTLVKGLLFDGVERIGFVSDALRFIGIFAIIALLSFAYSLWTWVSFDHNYLNAIIKV